MFGLNDLEVAEAQNCVEERVTEHLGMSMIFSLIEAAREWLRSKVLVKSNRMPLVWCLVYLPDGHL